MRYRCFDVTRVVHSAPAHAPKRPPANRFTMIHQCAPSSANETVGARNGSAVATTTKLMALFRMTASSPRKRNRLISNVHSHLCRCNFFVRPLCQNGHNERRRGVGLISKPLFKAGKLQLCAKWADFMSAEATLKTCTTNSAQSLSLISACCLFEPQ